MNPKVIAALLGNVIPGLSTLFGGGPHLPTFQPGEFQNLIAQLYKQLLNGPIGQGQLGQATVAGNQFGNALQHNLGQTGMNQSGVGQVVGAGTGSFSTLNRQQVLAALAQMAQSQANTLQQGQMQAGQYKWENPSGFKAFAGTLGSSAWPMILDAWKKQGGRPTAGSGPGGPVNWNEPYAGGGGV